MTGNNDRAAALQALSDENVAEVIAEERVADRVRTVAATFVDPFDVDQRPLTPWVGPNPALWQALRGALEVEGPCDDMFVGDDRLLQQRADDDLGERWGYEVGARRWLS